MLRKIINRINGRKKVTDKSMVLSEIQEMLLKLDETTKINMSYNSCVNSATFMNATPIDIAHIVRDRFEPDSITYCNANHQIFSGKQQEKHYIELRGGIIEETNGTTEFRRTPYKKAILDYVLEARE